MNREQREAALAAELEELRIIQQAKRANDSLLFLVVVGIVLFLIGWNWL
jgi:hypothetical protein